MMKGQKNTGGVKRDRVSQREYRSQVGSQHANSRQHRAKRKNFEGNSRENYYWD